MSKSDHIKDMNAKPSTPGRHLSQEQELMQDAILLDSQVERLQQIDPHCTSDKIQRWVQNWEAMRIEVNKMSDLTDELAHETVGSAKIFASEINGWVVTAVMLEMAFADPPKYVLMPDAMRESAPKDPNQYTKLEGDHHATIKVDREYCPGFPATTR